MPSLPGFFSMSLTFWSFCFIFPCSFSLSWAHAPVLSTFHLLILRLALQQARCAIRGKGEQGKPSIKANKPTPALSSEKERRESKPHHKAKKQAQIRIDRVEVVKVDQEQLPHDAQFKGYEEVTVVTVRKAVKLG